MALKPVIAGRVREPLYQRIKAAAELSGRSMSEEMEHRLELSFKRDEDALMTFLIRDAIAVEACLGG